MTLDGLGTWLNFKARSVRVLVFEISNYFCNIKPEENGQRLYLKKIFGIIFCLKDTFLKNNILILCFDQVIFLRIYVVITNDLQVFSFIVCAKLLLF